MMLEAGVVVDGREHPLYWHVPPNRSMCLLPDSQDLWDVLWEHRMDLLGFAHSHPGRGVPGPSWEDLTTFAAIESGLGRRLHWWICSEDALVELQWVGPEPTDYRAVLCGGDSLKRVGWLDKLRAVSYRQLPKEG